MVSSERHAMSTCHVKGSTYTRHQLEHRVLSLVIELNYFSHCLQQLCVRKLEASHATDQSISQRVVDVQLAGRPWC